MFSIWLFALVVTIPSFSLISFLGILITFSEDYLGKITYSSMKIIYGLIFSVPWIVVLSYILLSSFGIIHVSINVFLTVPMMIGNFINVYLYGIIAILIMFVVYMVSYGLILVSFFFISFLSSLSSFLYVLFILDSFSQMFQSLTLSNRLSINMFVGSLLTSLLSLFIKLFVNSIILLGLMGLLSCIFCFEILNSFIQLFIFMVLSYEYLLF